MFPALQSTYPYRMVSKIRIEHLSNLMLCKRLRLLHFSCRVSLRYMLSESRSTTCTVQLVRMDLLVQDWLDLRWRDSDAIFILKVWGRTYFLLDCLHRNLSMVSHHCNL